MIDVCWRKFRALQLPSWLACWLVLCCLALNGCAAKGPQADNAPSSYPPWVCGLSHNQDRWQCQRDEDEEGEEEGEGDRGGEEAEPSSAAPAKAGEPAPAKAPEPKPATGPATADAETKPPPAPTEHSPNGGPVPSPAADDAPSASADTVSAAAWQGPSAPASQREALTDPADEKNKLMELPADYFAIQAGAFSTVEALHRHRLQYGIEPAYQAQVGRDGQLFHVLILQVYDSRPAAEAALANLPQPLNGMDLWIRPVGSLQNAVRAGDALADERLAVP